MPGTPLLVLDNFFPTSDTLLYSPANCLGFCDPPPALLPIIAPTDRHVSVGTCHLLEMISSETAASVAFLQGLRLKHFAL